MARRPRADGSKFAIDAAAQLARTLPKPHQALSPNAEQHWPRIIGAKLLSLWTDIDLVSAWGLCEDLAALEEARLTLQREPTFYTDANGRISPHPAVKLVEEIERRVQATKRHLQIHAGATGGKADHQKTTNATARSIAATIADDDDGLFA